MSAPLTDLTIEARHIVSKGDHSAEMARMGLLALIQRRAAYEDRKLNPLHAVTEIANEILLGFSPIRPFHGQTVSLSPRFSLSIKRNSKGYFVLMEGGSIPADFESPPRY